MPGWLSAGIWGLVAGSALLVGAGVGDLVALKKRTIADVMAFGSGVLISALSFDLMAEAYRRGGFDSTSAGFLGGGVIYSIANWVLARHGAKNRKRSGGQQASESDQPGSGLAIAIGALLDGIPESMVIGISLLGGASVSMVAVVAIFISNIPEGLSSSAGMKKAGRPCAVDQHYGHFGNRIIDWIFVMQRHIGGFRRGNYGHCGRRYACHARRHDDPGAFDEARDWAGLLTVLGFLAAFILTKLGG
jgi:ZIP family zinc transporter